MKTPEEIKKGLALCVSAGSYNYPCEECPYVNEEDGCKNMMEDALALIQQLEANDSQVKKALQDNGFGSLEELLQAYSQVKRERDAGVRWVFNEEDAKNYKIPENVLTKQQMENLYLVGSDGKRSKMFSKRKEGVNDV